MFRVKSTVLAVGQPLPVYPKGQSASNVPTGNMTNLLDRLVGAAGSSRIIWAHVWKREPKPTFPASAQISQPEVISPRRLTPLPDIDKPASDRGRRRHRR